MTGMAMKFILFGLFASSLVICRDVSENERVMKANFIQKLINKHKHEEGNIKILGGPSNLEGNIYIWHAGRWGAVCDDSWGKVAASIVCKRFNKTGTPTFGSQYGLAKEKFWMDDVICEGDEQSLTKCRFPGWGISDCDIDEVAGVICHNESNEIMHLSKKKIGKRIQDSMNSVRNKFRLVGGRADYEGRIEIFHKGEWGSVCADGWTMYEALVVCKHLGFGFASQALHSKLFGSSKMLLSGVRCKGNETYLHDCLHNEIGDVQCPGDSGHVAAVTCTDKQADLMLDFGAIERTAHLQDVPMFLLQCAMEENCLTKSAYQIKEKNPLWQYNTRRLLRFTASSINIGNEDFKPYLPKHLWQWHLCHMHYHSMEVFATFDILDHNGIRVAEGHKASFCLEDNTCLPGVEKKFSCKNYGDQGISVNCSDVYKYNIDCQWVDVTDLLPGDYTFKVAINPHARVPEQTYDNNAATCQLRLTDTYAAVYNCYLHRP